MGRKLRRGVPADLPGVRPRREARRRTRRWGVGPGHGRAVSRAPEAPTATPRFVGSLFLRAAEPEEALGLLRFEFLRPLGGPADREGREDDYERDRKGVDELGGQGFRINPRLHVALGWGSHASTRSEEHTSE